MEPEKKRDSDEKQHLDPAEVPAAGGDAPEGYPLAIAAQKLQIHPSTLRFWEESFREELAVPRNWKGEAIFSDGHLQTIARIQRMVMGEGHTLTEARRAAVTGDFPFDDDDIVLPAPIAGEPSAAPESDQRAEDGDTDAAHPPAQWQREMEAIRGALAMLTEHVAYLLDENKSFQELFARLVEHVEGEGIGRRTTHMAAPSEPFVADPLITERIVDQTYADTGKMEGDATAEAAATSEWVRYEPVDPTDEGSDQGEPFEPLTPSPAQIEAQAGASDDSEQPQAKQPAGRIVGRSAKPGTAGSVGVQAWDPLDLGPSNRPGVGDRPSKQFAS